MKNLYKLLKITAISASLGIIISLSLANFLHSKMDSEINTYLKLSNDMKNLNDVYFLCSGLLSSNPTSENIQSCNLVYKNIETKINQIKEECPYITFYTEYFADIQN